MDKMQNFVVGDIVTPPSPASSGTSVTVNNGSYFPDPSTFGDYNLVMWDRLSGEIPTTSNCEIVRVTAKTTDDDNAILTITRAQESTSAKELGVNWQVYMSPTQKYFDDLKTYIDNLQLTKANLADATLIEDTTNTNSYAGSFAEPLTSYETGLIVNFKATNGNTGAATLNIDSLGAKSIKKNVSDDLTSGDIQAGQVVPLVYDGTNWQIVGGGGGSYEVASGSDINTGTDNTKFVTSKAIKDSNLISKPIWNVQAISADAQTFTFSSFNIDSSKSYFCIITFMLQGNSSKSTRFVWNQNIVNHSNGAAAINTATQPTRLTTPNQNNVYLSETTAGRIPSGISSIRPTFVCETGMTFNGVVYAQTLLIEL